MTTNERSKMLRELRADPRVRVVTSGPTLVVPLSRRSLALVKRALRRP